MNSLSFGSPAKSIDAGSIATQTGTSYALPSSAAFLAWQVSFAGTPASVTVLLEGSLDNSSWFTLDTTTSTSGAFRTVTNAVGFIRARVSAISAGTATSITVTLTPVGYSATRYAGGLVHQISAQLTNAQILALPTTPILVIPSPGSNRGLIHLNSFWRAVCVGDITNADVFGLLELAIGDPVNGSGYAASASVIVRGTNGLFAAGQAHHVSAGPSYGALDPTLYENRILAGPVSPAIDRFNNTGMYIAGYSNDDTDFTGGNAGNSLNINISYMIFNTSTGQFE